MRFELLLTAFLRDSAPDALATEASPVRPQPVRSALIRVLGVLGRAVLAVAPWLFIAGLLWAAIFVRPQPLGSTVQPPLIEERDAFFGAALPAPGVAWIVGSDGKILRSEGGLDNWHRQQAGTQEHLQHIAAWSGDEAVAVGNDGVVLYTRDGGETWAVGDAPRSEIANKLLRVRTGAAGEAWAVGEMGALLRTGDGGATWSRAMPEEDLAWADLSFNGAGVGVLVGEFGEMRRSTDGGASWEALPPVVDSSLTAIAFADDGRGVAVGLEGVILTSTDHGATWTAADSPTELHLFDVSWDPEAGHWLAVGDQGAWVTGRVGGDWASGRISENSMPWLMDAQPVGGAVLIVGAQAGLWEGPGGGWRPFTTNGE
ncbi:WD40/YVTN/BNR-like repeat-containing protein [Alkalilimnicola ehrlichii MLHE-1]|uniref:Glycosyl hydrolase, BNR repeat-containing protein n=1 Tax=Alkalilimnicola ehrlichii (strain ATCC BAA-1101 / DSM 17681 / MLHE-1) TaxID=187272 RepID=Q0A5S9_ALKEH|nr:YCF48-related protein [Alkalilimnicola ehrlichii]ABI57808.1 glycosyl hydrolase, BNR repeat-containing protein [Alkalilimnicola ehrlichii MLHE-1]